MFTSFSTALSALNATSTGSRRGGQQSGQPQHAGLQDQRGLLPRPGDGIAGRRPGRNPGRFRYRNAADHPPVHPGRDSIEHAACWTRRSQGTDSSSSGTPRATTLYTRAGNFQVDDTGNLQNQHRRSGAGMDHARSDHRRCWTPIGAIGDIVVPVGAAKQPIASSQFTLDLNLNSAAAADATSNSSGHHQGLRQPGHQPHADRAF